MAAKAGEGTSCSTRSRLFSAFIVSRRKQNVAVLIDLFALASDE
jgi:hypothetical protein